MDPILIGTAVSVVSYTTDSTALVPSRNVCREGNERKSRCKRLQKPGRKQKISASILAGHRNISRNALSLLDNSLNIHHFGM